MIEWNRRVNDAVVEWSRGAGIPMPDVNDLVARGWVSSVNFAFPHYFLLPVYGNASSYRVRPLGPEETLFEMLLAAAQRVCGPIDVPIRDLGF